MAQEPINILQSDARGLFDVLFLYTITTPKQLKGANIVVTPSTDLPRYAADIIDPEQVAGLDDGSLAFEVFQYQKARDVSNQQQIEQLRQIFANRETLYNQKYAAEYQYLGQRLAKTQPAEEENTARERDK